MPKYKVLDTVIESQPNFKDLEQLSTKIIQKSILETKKIYPNLF